MTKFFNTALASNMLPNAAFEVSDLTDEQVVAWMNAGFENRANPSHGNTLRALNLRFPGLDFAQAKGGKIQLEIGDECLVAEIEGLPRETREFTDEEVAKATFKMRLYRVVSKPDADFVQAMGAWTHVGIPGLRETDDGMSIEVLSNDRKTTYVVTGVRVVKNND